ncbi:hypothetical protein C6P40_002399 [Pichia californica]|uniref:Skg3/CAF120-like PH-like domain-containing protein n=1 Tax=Pichia californica TaxID=460514 RepID=A0A9P6WHR2_9ASCO|nr:hypothetical protein C6P40_002399 [[Candida] californica]
MQKLRVFSKSKEKDSPHSTLEKPSTPKFRDFSLNLTRSNSNSNLNVNFTPPSSPIPSTLESGGKLSPELAPIVSLLTAQSHRKYSEGIFMLLKDLDSDGNPSDRKWIEVYGIMIGNELAYWDSDQLESVGSAVVGDKKPSYLNFSDGTFKTCPSLPSANGNIDNVIVLSTTLKNRFLLQFSSDEDFINWSLAFRLSAYEYKSLQEAYTASLLSARGSLLSDIRVILSEKKFDYEDWTSVRFGAGMPWKRCFAVIEPSKKTRKGFKNGNIYFYDNEKKNKKLLMAKITNISSVYALYPRTYTIIDKSTMIKLEGSIQFDVKENSKDCSIFLMPEQHTSVPGYDTLIRFLIPLMDSFNLYGRPKKLNADKLDPNSLLFGLPVLPKVHYLELKDLKSIINKSSASLDWDQHEWNTKIKEIIKVKINNGYTGCGSSDGINGALDLLNSSKDLATGKVKFFVSKPEVNKYLENSPHAKGLTKFQTSSDEFTVNSSTTPLSQNASKNKFNDLESDRNDSLYSKSRSEFSNTPGPLLPSQTPLQSEEGVLPKTSPSPQVVNIYQKYSQIPDSEKLNSNNLSNSFNDLRIEDHSPKKQSTENDPSVTSFGVYGPMKSHSPQMNQQGFQNNNRSFSGPGTNQGRSNAPGPNYSTGYNHQPSHQQGFNNTNHAYPPPQQQQQQQQQQQNYQHQHHHQNYHQHHQQQHQQHQVLPPQQNGYLSQQQQQGYYNGNSQYQQNYGQPVPPQLQYGQAPPTAGNRGARYRQPPPQMQQPQSGKSFKHDPYALAKLN